MKEQMKGQGEKPLKIVVVGGVAGGGSASARARRLNEEASIVMFERGPYTSFANCGLPYYLAGEIKERDCLFLAGETELNGWLNIDVRTQNEVTSINRSEKKVEARNLKTGKTYFEPYDYLILSPGAEPIRPPTFFKNIQPDHPRVLSLRTVPDVDKMKKLIEGGIKNVVIVGGGFIGLELAEAFVHQKVQTTLVELLPQVMPVMDAEMVVPVHEVLRKHGVELLLGDSVEGLEPSGESRLEVKLASGKAFNSDLVVLAIGVRPDSFLAKEAELELNERGAIKVNEHLLTSDPHIYAVGDAIQVKDPILGEASYVPLAGPANRQGRLAADHIMARERCLDVDSSTIQYRGTIGSSVCRVFETTVASTGKTQRMLERSGRVLHKDFEITCVHPKDHAGYYPGAAQLSLKICFEKPSGKILGAQAVGEKGLDKRIDVLSMAIQKGATVFDLEETELCYSPPFGSAKDPINMAGFQAANILSGKVDVITAGELLETVKKLGSNLIVLDVRKTTELEECGKIPDAVNIPLHELRLRLDEISRDKEIITYCQVGFRGYIAYRMLKQRGYAKVKNLVGGYLSWKRSQC